MFPIAKQFLDILSRLNNEHAVEKYLLDNQSSHVHALFDHAVPVDGCLLSHLEVVPSAQFIQNFLSLILFVYDNQWLFNLLPFLITNRLQRRDIFVF